VVGQVVAVKAVDSATKDGGILNQLIKIITIVSILGALLVVGVILFLVFNIWEAVGGTFSAIGSVLGNSLTFFSPITFFTTIVATGFGFARR
jgi:pheromone shutdown protein TraB